MEIPQNVYLSHFAYMPLFYLTLNLIRFDGAELRLKGFRIVEVLLYLGGERSDQLMIHPNDTNVV